VLSDMDTNVPAPDIRTLMHPLVRFHPFCHLHVFYAMVPTQSLPDTVVSTTLQEQIMDCHQLVVVAGMQHCRNLRVSIDEAMYHYSTSDEACNSFYYLCYIMHWYLLTMLTIVMPEQVWAWHTILPILHRSSLEDPVYSQECG
jgi:hypothetical protein